MTISDLLLERAEAKLKRRIQEKMAANTDFATKVTEIEKYREQTEIPEKAICESAVLLVVSTMEGMLKPDFDLISEKISHLNGRAIWAYLKELLF